MIPQGFIQDLLARVDIVEVVGRYVQLKKAGQNHLGLCPFHGEKTPSFTVSGAKQFFHCFGCGAHGSAIGFLMDHRGLSYVEAIRELAQSVGMTVPDAAPGSREREERSRGLTDLLQRAGEFYRTQLKSAPEAIDYLKGRGLTGATAARYGLGYSPDQWQALRAVFDPYDDPALVEAGLVIVGDEGRRYDRFRGRVMFPIRNRRGAVIGFGARVLGAGEPKYLNSPETPVFHKGRELYGVFEAQEAIRARGRVIVCEGYLDVIQLAQAGFGEAVAALGTAFTPEHASALLRLADRVVFAFDGDAAGRKAARRALEAVMPLVAAPKSVSFLLLPEGEDPDSLVKAGGPAAFEAALGKALPLSRWFLQVVSDSRDLSQAEGRAAVLDEARPMLAAMQPGALRQQLTRELAEAVRTPAQEVETLFGLRAWQRLPAGDERRPRRQGAPVGELRSAVLRHLLANPAFAREFNAEIAAECLDSDAPLDRQIVEVWRVATGQPGCSSAALLEMLADSEHAARYRELLIDDFALSEDAQAAAADLRGAFQKLELGRLEAQRDALARRIAAGEGGTAMDEYRVLMVRHAEIKRLLSAGDAMPVPAAQGSVPR